MLVFINSSSTHTQFNQDASHACTREQCNAHARYKPLNQRACSSPLRIRQKSPPFPLVIRNRLFILKQTYSLRLATFHEQTIWLTLWWDVLTSTNKQTRAHTHTHSVTHAHNNNKWNRNKCAKKWGTDFMVAIFEVNFSPYFLIYMNKIVFLIFYSYFFVVDNNWFRKIGS